MGLRLGDRIDANASLEYTMREYNVKYRCFPCCRSEASRKSTLNTTFHFYRLLELQKNTELDEKKGHLGRNASVNVPTTETANPFDLYSRFIASGAEQQPFAFGRQKPISKQDFSTEKQEKEGQAI